MKLYTVVFTHYAQKGDEEGIHQFILAENDEQVYRILKSTAYWDDDAEIYDGDEVLVGTNKEDIIAHRGDYHREEVLKDLYYGSALYCWDEGKRVTEQEVAVLSKFLGCNLRAGHA